MTLKEMVVGMQLEALGDADFNGLNGPGVRDVLIRNRDKWSMVYFGGDEIAVFPVAGKEDELSALFDWPSDDEEREVEELICGDEIGWQEVDGKRYVSVWWD